MLYCCPGAVAVSQRYAEQISAKLSVFWQLGVGRVCGVLNALDVPQGALVARHELSLQQKAELKRDAKMAHQRRAGLEVGEHFSLLVFLGRCGFGSGKC